VTEARLADGPKKAAREGYTIVVVDASGFRLLPMRVRTWALRGQTPRLRVPRNPDHLSVIGGIRLDGRRVTGQLDQAGVCLGHPLLRHLAGTALIIWDGRPAHRSAPPKTSCIPKPLNACG
jgi:hypothetical protein